VTVREVAERLEVSVSLTYRLIAAGKLRCSRHGLGRGAIRISEEQLGEYLASVERGSQPRPDAAVHRVRLKHLRL
jgi:excisionase family DNA binding protein